MKQEEIKKLVKEHGEKVAPNDFEKTKLARKYNTETRFYDETIEAKILDCEVLPYDPRFPDPSIWKVLDSMDAVKMLQGLIDKIDKEGKK